MSSDQQPLLSSAKTDIDQDERETDQRLYIKNFFDWRQLFMKKTYSHTDIDHTPKPVNFLQLFRFADRLDLVLVLTGLLLNIIDACFSLMQNVLFGQLTGVFAMESFAHTCRQQEQNSIDAITGNITCPFGINLDAINFNHFHRLCENNTMSTFPSIPGSSTHAFREKVMRRVYLLFVVSVGEFLCITIGASFWMISIRRQVSRMNMRLFRSLLQRNISFFDTTSTSQSTATLFSNIDTIERGIGLEFIILIYTLFCIFGSFITSLIVNWKLTLIILCILPFVFGASFIFSKITTAETLNEIIAQSKSSRIVEEVFSSLRTVLSFNGAQHEQKRYERELSRTRWNSIRKGAVFGLYTGWLAFVTYIIYAVGFIFGSILMSYEDQSRFNIGDIISILSVFALAVAYMASIGPFYQALAEAQAAAALVFRVIDEADDSAINEKDLWKEDQQSPVRSTSDVHGDIEFDEATFIYPSRQQAPVLNRLSFVARAGQTTALVGSSGCGKSTCISLLLRQYDLAAGEITISGQLINSFNLKQLRQNIGVVSQEPTLFNLSICENIRYGKVNATRAEIEEAAKQANAHNFIMQLPEKYQTRVGERGIQLSGGEKQRIALARALVKQPAILLLDEATSALDNANEKIVQEALDRACKNRTTIVIAHRLTTIQNADQIYVLEKGSVCEEGTHATLMRKEGGKYQAMVRKQQLETLNETVDDEVNVEDSEESIRRRSRVLSDAELAAVQKESTTSSKEQSPFFRLLAMSRPEWTLLVVACVLSAIIGLAQTSFLIVLAKIVNAFDYCASSRTTQRVLLLSCLILLLGVLILVFRFVQYTIFAQTGSRLTERIRIKTFACLLRQETAYFDQPENSSGAISLRLSSDATAFEQMVGTRLGVITETVALVFCGFVFGIFFSWQLTLIVAFMCLLMVLLGYMVILFDVELRKQCRDMLQEANTFAIEFIHNLRTIKQLSVENYITEQYSESVQEAARKFWKSDLLTDLTFALLYGLESCFWALLYWCALVLVESNKLDLSNVIMVFSFALFATQSVKLVGMLAERVGQSLSTAQKFFDLFDRTPAIDNSSTQGRELAALRGDIQFDQVKFFYPTRPTSLVLNKFHLSIKSGQRVALVGASGCGKSTVAQLLERFYDVTKGRVLIDGVDIRELNIQWLRSRLGLVGQEPVLFDLSIAENITYGLENVPIEEIINAATKANIADLIHQLPQGYDTPVGVKGSFLSGGEKQRIAIARVLLRRPKILLLDEATSALDLHNEQIVQEALDQAQIEDAGRTSLIIAHRLSTIRSCDLICVVEGERIAESGTHAELMEQGGIYYRMLAQQVT